MTSEILNSNSEQIAIKAEAKTFRIIRIFNWNSIWPVEGGWFRHFWIYFQWHNNANQNWRHSASEFLCINHKLLGTWLSCPKILLFYLSSAEGIIFWSQEIGLPCRFCETRSNLAVKASKCEEVHCVAFWKRPFRPKRRGKWHLDHRPPLLQLEPPTAVSANKILI
jgi:hypothetical protein